MWRPCFPESDGKPQPGFEEAAREAQQAEKLNAAQEAFVERWLVTGTYYWIDPVTWMKMPEWFCEILEKRMERELQECQNDPKKSLSFLEIMVTRAVKKAGALVI